MRERERERERGREIMKRTDENKKEKDKAICHCVATSRTRGNKGQLSHHVTSASLFPAR